jgi:hypothetical protein
MSARPDVHTPGTPPPEDRQPGPSGVPFVLATAALFLLALVIVGLLALGGWVAFAAAILLLLLGLFGLSRYVQRIAWTRSSRVHLRRGLAGMNDDLSNTDDAHEDISPRDLPLDNPAHQEVEERIREEQEKLPEDQRSAAPTFKP